MNIIVDEVTYVPVANPAVEAGKLCDHCDLYQGKGNCRLQDLNMGCGVHHYEVYKISLKEKLRKL